MKKNLLALGTLSLLLSIGCSKKESVPKPEPQKPDTETPKPDPLAKYIISTASEIVIARHEDMVLTAAYQQGLDQLTADLSALKTQLSAGIWNQLKADTLWLENHVTTIEYLPLSSNESRKGRIRVGNLAKYKELTGKNQKSLLANVIAKQYFDKYLSNEKKTQIENHYSSIKDNKYKRVYYSDGVKLIKSIFLDMKTRQDAVNYYLHVPPASQSAHDYFAEITEAYLGENDYYPFDIQDLARYDAEGMALLANIWGEQSIPENPNGITLPPSHIKQWLEYQESDLDLYYSKYLDFNGLPIVASRFVSDDAMLQARYIIETMMERIPESLEQMIKYNFRIGIVGAYENVTDLPENRLMNVWWPGTDWDARGRGYGATEYLPLMTCGEENIIKIPNYNERYPRQSIMVHEFAHNVDFGLRKGRPGFEDQLVTAYNNAITKNLWTGTYAMTNTQEYFAVAAQAWYNTAENPVNTPSGVKRIKTREDLKEYDRELYDLLATVFSEKTLTGYHFTFE
jgi:ABC-type transporter Mla MlaB component